MASFQAKIGCQRPQKRENENYRSVPLRSYPTHKTKPQKNSKKFKKFLVALWLHFKPKQVGKGREREKIKIIIPFRYNPKRNRKFQKNSKKIQKYHYGFFSTQNRLEKSEKE